MFASEILRKSSSYAGDHSTTILTVMGVSGTISTAYLTGRASFKAAAVIEKEEKLNLERFVKQQVPYDHLTQMDRLKLVWPLYIPAISVGTTTIAAIIMANQLASKKIAALVVASGVTERAFQEYKEKVIEKVGSVKETKVRDEIAQDRVDKHPVNTREVIIAGTGEVLCFDMATGRYFQSTVEEIKQAVNRVNFDIVNHMYASLSQFYDELGLPPTTYSESVGWNTNDLLEIELSTTMSSDGRPCIAVDFKNPPIADYTNLY